MTTFSKWIDAFLKEKSVDQDRYLEVKGPSGINHFPVSILVDVMKEVTHIEQEKIKADLVRIDFHNPGPQPVVDYLEHIGQAIAS